MACVHKFYKDLHLERLDFEPETLIVGTFNPEWPDNNTAEWFYGRTKDSYFWDVLPRMYSEDSLIKATQVAWKQFCRDKKIALTDLISSIDDADPDSLEHNKMLGGFSDKAIAHNFDEYEYVNIVKLLQQHDTIKYVYLTRGINELFWRHLWNPVTHYCNHNGLRERKLLTPSDEALYQYGAYNRNNPETEIHLLEDYILMRWKQEWHF